MNDLESASQVRERDNRTLEELVAADGALLRALQALPSSKHTAFELPQDAEAIDRCRSTLRVVMAAAEAKHHRRDQERGTLVEDH